MNKKDLGEIRRRLALGKCNINHVYGCYVNTNKEIISYIDVPLDITNQTVSEMFLALVKKATSGTLGKNLIDIDFTTDQVSGEGKGASEYKKIMELRSKELKDESLRKDFFNKVINNLNIDEKYLILMAYDTYDVPFRGSDDEKYDEFSEEMFAYLICAVCPVKDSTPKLSFSIESSDFKPQVTSDIGSPIIGFMFPSFDDRQCNIYRSLYYCKSPSEIHEEFIQGIFNSDIPMSQPEQREHFETALAEASDGACGYDVVRGISERVREIVDEHKENKEEEPLTMTVEEIGDILEDSGMEVEKVMKFKEVCNHTFGEFAELRPTNIVDNKKFIVNTANVVISVKPEKSYLVDAEIIEGRKVIVVDAEEGVEINGIGVCIE